MLFLPLVPAGDIRELGQIAACRGGYPAIAKIARFCDHEDPNVITFTHRKPNLSVDTVSYHKLETDAIRNRIKTNQGTDEA